MARLPLAMLACLVFGAAGMWLSSNFKLKVEPVAEFGHAAAAPVAATPVQQAPAEPGLLPGHIVGRTPTPMGGVQQAGGMTDPADEPAPPAKPVAEVESVLQITAGSNLVFDSLTSAIPLASDTPIVTLEEKAGSTFKFKIGDGELKDITGADSGAATGLTLDLKAGSPPGTSFTVTIVRTVGTGDSAKTSTAKITVVRPLASNKFFVDSLATTEGLPLLPPATAATKTTVFGTFVKVHGRGFGTFQEPKFLLFTGGKTAEVPRAVAVAPTSVSGHWEYLLTLPALNNNSEATLVCRGTFSDGHAYAETVLPLTIGLLPATLAPPMIAIRTADDKSDETPATSDQQIAGLTTYLFNRRTLKVTVTPVGPDAKAVALYLGAAQIDTKPFDGVKPIAFDIPSVGSGREHVLRAIALVADSKSPDAAVAVNVVTTRPSVDSVLAPGFGGSSGVGSEKIRIRFNTSENKLDRKTLTPAAFEVLHNEGTGTATLAPGAPEYDEGTNTVTLTAAPIKPGSYAVRVKTIVADIYGNKVAGLVKADIAYEATLFTGTPDGPVLPSQSAGVSASGPNAVFPEYTDFRVLKDGFNPSDRVESRVVRLYYSRDAHRVAQIVNRDVKSYNGPAVDVRRRASDKVRDEANGAQDERQRLERAAVQAAVATRMAENEVKQLEAKLQTAKTEQGTTRVQLPQREQQLAAA